MRTTLETLEDNKVKLTIEVDEEELASKTDETIRQLTKDARIPGFRPGKVPRRLLESRLGPKAIRDEVLRDALPHYYSDAVEESALDVIAAPEIDITSGEDGGSVSFDAVVEVRPEVSVAGYQGLVVTIPSPTASDGEIDAQIDRLREQFAELKDVKRAVRDGDFVTLNIDGTQDGAPAEGLSADDLVYEVGTGGIVDGIDERLFGTKVGDIFEMDSTEPPVHLKVLVRLVREKHLPEVNDDFASDASEFENLSELRSDLSGRLDMVKRYQANIALRERSLEALANLVADEPPKSLVSQETSQLLDEFIHRLGHQQVGLEDYLQATNKTPETFLSEIEQQATFQVKADLALRALALAESVEVDESDLDEEIVRLATQAKKPPGEVRTTLDRSGRLAGLRSQLKNAKALAWLVENVSIVDEEGNSVDRESLAMNTEEQAENESSTHEHDHEHLEAKH